MNTTEFTQSNNKQVLNIYKDRYVFQQNKSEIEIFDISDKKVIGNFIL